MTYKVQSGVAIPPPVRGSRPSKYPFATMAVGDVFFVVNAPKAFAGQVSSVGRRLGRKFATRRVTLIETSIGMSPLPEGKTPIGPTHQGIGVWRVADNAVLRHTKR